MGKIEKKGRGVGGRGERWSKEKVSKGNWEGE